MKRIILCLFFIWLCPTRFPPARAALSEPEVYALAAEARSLFNQANESAGSNREAATLKYDQAILRYQKIIDEGGVRNAYLYYNIANAHLLKDNLGLAILNYRRAQHYGKTTPELAKNLSYARSQRRDRIPEKVEKKILHTLFFWHYDFDVKTKFILACSGWSFLCLLGALALLTRRLRAWLVLLATLVLLTGALAASVGLDAWRHHRDIQGVIIADGVVARQGNGENYPVSFKEPLHAGTEFHLHRRSEDWLGIELANGDAAWIPAGAAELI